MFAFYKRLQEVKSGGRERVEARRASQWRTVRAGPRGSADSFLDGRLAGTGPSAHRMDSGPIGLSRIVAYVILLLLLY